MTTPIWSRGRHAQRQIQVVLQFAKGPAPCSYIGNTKGRSGKDNNPTPGEAPPLEPPLPRA